MQRGAGRLTMTELPFLCPSCNSEVLTIADDVGARFFKCSIHGLIKDAKQQKIINPDLIEEPFNTVDDINDQTPISQIPENYIVDKFKAEKLQLAKIEVGLENLAVNPEIEDLLLMQAHQTISPYDDHIIKIAFHVGLSVFHKPLNLALKCESGSGKSYGITEILKFLPPENVFLIGSQSPKVFSHENGIKKTPAGDVIDEKNRPVKPEKSDYGDISEYNNMLDIYKLQKEKWDKDNENAIYEVDLRGKIICFLESVNLECFKMLKCTMSHDSEFIDHKYVDDKQKVHVTRLVGAPVLIFNSLDNEYIEEFATRCFTATPNTRTEKIEDANKISNQKSCYPWLYSNDDLNKRILQEYIRKVKQAMEKGKLCVLNPFDGLYAGFSKDATRDMRDFNKFLELMPSYAMFKLFQRPIVTIHGKRYLIPTVQDALDAKSAFDAIIDTTKTGTDYRVLDFYYKVVADRVNGCDAEFLTDLYNKERKHKTTVHTVRHWLIRLGELGWVDVRDGIKETSKGYVDKRFNNYFPLKKQSTAIEADLNSAVYLKAILEKSFEKWLNNADSEIDSQTKIFILNIDGTAKRISIERLKEIVLDNSIKNKTESGDIELSTLNLNSISKEEKKAESTADSKTAVGAALSSFKENDEK
jgi:hypothetical protein